MYRVGEVSPLSLTQLEANEARDHGTFTHMKSSVPGHYTTYGACREVKEGYHVGIGPPWVSIPQVEFIKELGSLNEGTAHHL